MTCICLKRATFTLPCITCEYMVKYSSAKGHAVKCTKNIAGDTNCSFLFRVMNHNLSAVVKLDSQGHVKWKPIFTTHKIKQGPIALLFKPWHGLPQLVALCKYLTESPLTELHIVGRCRFLFVTIQQPGNDYFPFKTALIQQICVFIWILAEVHTSPLYIDLICFYIKTKCWKMLHLALLKKADKQTDAGGNITSLAEVKIITGPFKIIKYEQFVHSKKFWNFTKF